MVVAMRTTRRTIRLVLHQSTFPVWGPWDSYLRLSYLYFRCCTRLCDVITTFVVNTAMMVFNLWLMCVIDLWTHISLCIQFLPWNWVWHFSNHSTGAIENMYFIFSKASNPTSQAQWEGERNPNPSLPFKLHLLCKCANTTKWPPPLCMCVSISQTFSSKELG